MSCRVARPFLQQSRSFYPPLRLHPNPSRFRSLTISSHLCQEDHSHLQSSLPKRRLPINYDYLVPTPSHLLTTALADILPNPNPNNLLPTPPPRPSTTNPATLPKSHHLIYFPPAVPGSALLPDGTDPLQSPGPPFVRRMWAGGSVRFRNQPPTSSSPLLLDGRPAAVLESIRDVTIKGSPGDEKVFVGIERRVGTLVSDAEDEDSVRSRLWRDDEAEFGESVGVIERRNIVFLRERARGSGPARDGTKAAPAKQMAPPSETSDFDVTVMPDQRLLFRYSALTYNAHSIHLDPQYCREVEGYRGMLVHGPLSFTLLMTTLERVLGEGGKGETTKLVEYRNLAPLYYGEKLRLRGRRVKEVEGAEGRWELWAETPEGGLAVKANVKTEIPQ